MNKLNEMIDKMIADSPHVTRIMSVEYLPPRLWILKTMSHFIDGKTLEEVLKELVVLEIEESKGAVKL